MQEKVARLTVVTSTRNPEELSLRGPLGLTEIDTTRHVAADPFYTHLKAAGFQPNERVVLITEGHFEQLQRGAK